MINYAHRGASEYAPENTMAAFCLGIEMGANGIETDVQRTKDGVLLLCHDATFQRTAGVDRPVCDMTWAEVSKLDVGSFKGDRYRAERVVPLADFVRYFGAKQLYFAVEIKQSGIEREVLEQLRGGIPFECLTITSFMLDSLLALAGETDRPRLGYLAREFIPALLDMLKDRGIEEYCPDARFLDADMACETRTRGLGLRAWGVKTEALMRRMCDLDVDGMTVNFPDKLKAHLE